MKRSEELALALQQRLEEHLPAAVAQADARQVQRAQRGAACTVDVGENYTAFRAAAGVELEPLHGGVRVEHIADDCRGPAVDWLRAIVVGPARKRKVDRLDAERAVELLHRQRRHKNFARVVFVGGLEANGLQHPVGRKSRCDQLQVLLGQRDHRERGERRVCAEQAAEESERASRAYLVLFLQVDAVMRVAAIFEAIDVAVAGGSTGVCEEREA